MRLAMIGIGVVGQGLVEILAEKCEFLAEEYGFQPRVVAVSDIQKGSVYKQDGLDLELLLSLLRTEGSIHTYPGGTKDLNSLQTIEKTDADVMLELTWTNLKSGEPAITHIRRALERGMSVVTSNKGPVALAGQDLGELARSRKGRLLFEGTVMAGTPVLNLAMTHLRGCQFKEIRGILNGTTNFILTRMEEGQSYGEALQEAQDLGFAEAVPDNDVEGWDSLAKIIILSNFLMGANLSFTDAARKGITSLTGKDIEEAREEGKRWKLVASAKREGEKVVASVGPEKVAREDPLFSLAAESNGVCFRTDLLGEVTIAGPGAGGRATGFSLLADLLTLNHFCG